MSLDPQQTAVIKAPVGPKAAFDAVKERGVHGYDETSGCPTICPGDGLDYVRSTIHPDDASPASPLSGSETVTVLQAGELVETTVQAIVDLQPSGSYQPLDSDLTAIAALSTQVYGRSLLTLASNNAARDQLGATSRSLFSRRYTANLSTTPVEVASFTIAGGTFNGEIPGAPRLLKIHGTVATQFAVAPVPFVMVLKANGSTILSKALTVPAGTNVGASLSIEFAPIFINIEQYYFADCPHTTLVHGASAAVAWQNIELDASVSQTFSVELSVSSGTESAAVWSVVAELS